MSLLLGAGDANVDGSDAAALAQSAQSMLPAPPETSPASIPSNGKSRKGEYCRARLIEKEQKREDDILLLRLAVAHAQGHGIGARATVSLGLFPGVSRNQLNNALQGRTKMLHEDARHAQSVLTRNERHALAQWVANSAINKNPATDADISKQVVLMLRARRADNRRRRHGRGCIPLTKPEARLADEAGAEVSHVWLTKWQAQFPWVSKQKERNADAARTKKQNEGVVYKHFYGEFGIVASLESIGNLDMVTKRIKDQRRVWWLDEMGID